MTTSVLPAQKGETTYTYSSQPRVIPQKKKYRESAFNEPENARRYGNLMYDRRVFRGNTYSQHVIPVTAQPDPVEQHRQVEQRRRALARKRAQEQLRPRTPEAPDGSAHQTVQTELYLEELTDRIEEADQEAQTDAFLDRPPSPLFVPAKTGQDTFTQVEETDLFDFDLESKPILEVLVGKTIEQSLLEVMEEEELANLRSQQRVFEELRAAELVEQQRLEEKDRRHREEKQRRIEQEEARVREQRDTTNRIAARAFAQSYLADLVPIVFGTLGEHGYFYDPVEKDVEEGFIPWLMDEIVDDLNLHMRARSILDGMIREAVTERHIDYRKLDENITGARLAKETANVLKGGEKMVLDEAESDKEIEKEAEEEPVVENDDDAADEDDTNQPPAVTVTGDDEEAVEENEDLENKSKVQKGIIKC